MELCKQTVAKTKSSSQQELAVNLLSWRSPLGRLQMTMMIYLLNRVGATGQPRPITTINTT